MFPNYAAISLHPQGVDPTPISSGKKEVPTNLIESAEASRETLGQRP